MNGFPQRTAFVVVGCSTRNVVVLVRIAYLLNEFDLVLRSFRVEDGSRDISVEVVRLLQINSTIRLLR